MKKQMMTVSMDGLRHNLAGSYNDVVKHLREYIENNLTDFECDELCDAVFEDFEELKQNISLLLCVFDPDGDSDFTNMSQEAENLESFELEDHN